MTNPLYLYLYIPLVFIALYIAYQRGNLTIQRCSSFMFIGGRTKKNKSSASFNSCTGYTKRIVYLKELQEYNFNFIANLEKGRVILELLNEDKILIQTFDTDENSDALTNVVLNLQGKYYVTVKFEEASGVYELNWY